VKNNAKVTISTRGEREKRKKSNIEKEMRDI
jgi:hypothetical protein